MLRDESLEVGSPRIILLAESYDPEVILTADWLSGFGVDIAAFTVSSLTHNDETFLSIDQRFPLLAVDDLYVTRGKRTVKIARDEPTWDEVLETLNYSFAHRAVETFRKHKDGSPRRRCFFSIYAESPLGRMRINMRQQYIKIYTRDQSPEAHAILSERLGPSHSVGHLGIRKDS